MVVRPALLRLFSVTLMLHLLLVIVQAGFAGSFLSGSDIAVAFHSINSLIIGLVCLIQLAITIRMRVLRACPTWVLLAAIVLVLAEAVQIYAGVTRLLSVHVPLAVAIAAVIAGLIGWTLSRGRAMETAQ